MKSRLRRLLPVLAACALWSACGGNEPDTNGAQDETPTASAATSARIVIHMTGMVLVVPPKPENNEVHVLLPPVDTPKHLARLGFGIDAENSVHAPILCADTAAVEAGICYVDLATWTWEQFGDGGSPIPDGLELPRGVLNATRLSGGVHKVRASAASPRRVVLRAGWAGPTHCSLANWTYTPRGRLGQARPAETQALVNVLDWEIDGLSEPTLTFRRTNPDTVITVPLVDPQNGRIELILANIPMRDYEGLPPRAATDLETVPNNADHVGAYYTALSDEANRPPPGLRRPIPHTPRPITTRACPVAITVTEDKRSFIQGQAAIATYACVVGTGDPG